MWNLSCSVVGTVLGVRVEWRMGELCELEEDVGGVVLQMHPPHRSCHLSLAPSSHLFLPVSI